MDKVKTLFARREQRNTVNKPTTTHLLFFCIYSIIKLQHRLYSGT